ncbi:MAG: nucleotidyltransferase domain-containing protein [Aestuariivirga sp.]
MKNLEILVAVTLARPVAPEIGAMADHVRGLHNGVVAVLAYGSCLRGIATADSLIDLYVLTADFSGVSPNSLSRMGCALAPPNVYYAELDIAGHRLRAKYAVMPLPLFAEWMTAPNPYFWARFAQPSALLFSTDDRTATAIAQAVCTMYGHALGLSADDEPLAVWAKGFAATYGTELRAEASANRAASLVAANENYYRTAAALMPGVTPVKANWAARRMTGKLWSLARLIKAAFTFVGGADYLAWKIERHSGHRIELTDWQRRHPVIAGLTLLPKLLKRGAVR